MKNTELNTIAVSQIFQKHYDYYQNIGVETIQQQAGQVEQVSSDYQGRVIYELLQNAFDKAHKKIIVKVVNNVLYIANDGTRFNYVIGYDYLKNNSLRGDFQSLCSISTSTKTAATSIGNKGVGFKSAFSIAEDNFVNVFTDGELVYPDGSKGIERINFRIYDTFKDPDLIPADLDENIGDNLKEKIDLIQRSFPDRGVPGYYFPLRIFNYEDIIQQLFNDGFVTVIQIHLANRQEITKLFNEIKAVHFQFVRLKYPEYPADFSIDFSIDDDEKFERKISDDTNKLCSVKIQNAQLTKLAKEAGISIAEPEVSIFIKENAKGLIYNYLPTQVKSPFKHIDFHADFHTTVDRKSINFDGKIGAYNKALLQACIELYFEVLNSYLDEGDKIDFGHTFINAPLVDFKLQYFDWNYFQIFPSNQVYQLVRNALEIWNYNVNDYSYETSSYLIAALAAKYFKIKRTEEQHHSFFTNIVSFIEYFGRNDGQEYKWLDLFKTQLAQALKEKKANVIPEFTDYTSKELVFRKASDLLIKVPDFIGINITSFEIKDVSLRKILGIKEFTDFNEILKYFRQTSYSGDFNKESITETQQQEVLKSLMLIFTNKREQIQVSTHRYLKMYNSRDRENNSLLNQANFNISTVFLKTKTGRYKPAQLCKKIDLDLHFLNFTGLDKELDSFLKFLGVSLDTSYIFADNRIFKALKDGLNFIPTPFGSNSSIEKLTGETILKNIRVISTKECNVHPALINDNNYTFLSNISGSKIKLELDSLLVKQYESFPEEYVSILFDKVKTAPPGIERLYPKIFQKFHEFHGQYLTKKRHTLQWIDKSGEFYIVKNEGDFEKISKNNIPILYYSELYQVPQELNQKIVEIVDGSIEITDVDNVTDQMVETLNNRMVFILSAISRSSLSDLNYKEDSSKVLNIQSLLRNLKVMNVGSLKREMFCKGIDIKFDSTFDTLIDYTTSTIYFRKDCTTRRKTESISRYLFSNISIVSDLEIILFLKTPEELESDYSKEEQLFFKSIWVEDYKAQFQNFVLDLLNGLINSTESPDNNWFTYNASYKSPVLIELSSENKLSELQLRIEQFKGKYHGLFDDFCLNIDFSLNDERVSKMLAFLSECKGAMVNSYVIELQKLTKCLGVDESIDRIEQELIELFKYSTATDETTLSSKKIVKQIEVERKVESIYANISKVTASAIGEYTAAGTGDIMPFHINHKKLIFQGTESFAQDGSFLEATGAGGEVEVLGYYISFFLTFSIEERRKGINEIYDTIALKLGNDSHLIFKKECLKSIGNNEKLRKALIPFLYIAMHYKFSYFDIIAYKDGKPVIIEVKTTQNSNNRSFFISNAEINEAIKEKNYEIVRVTPTEIIFMGNPIKNFINMLGTIQGANYKLTPGNYKFEFSK